MSQVGHCKHNESNRENSLFAVFRRTVRFCLSPTKTDGAQQVLVVARGKELIQRSKA